MNGCCEPERFDIWICLDLQLIFRTGMPRWISFLGKKTKQKNMYSCGNMSLITVEYLFRFSILGNFAAQ